MKKPLLLFIFLVLGLILIRTAVSSTLPAKQPVCQPELLIYWGEGCSHCENVKDFISKNNLQDKICLVYKEVFSNQANAREMAENVKNCPEIDSSAAIGVPLGFDTNSSKCFYGDQPIIDFLSQKFSLRQ
ncbi:MAG: hypothetical protein WC686_01670 [Candidatus Shapirobacteria bacterium]|jgi:hypothetical protein